MDDQAHQLRRLMQAYRQAAQNNTGPPLFLIASPNATAGATKFCRRLHELAGQRGIRTAVNALDEPAGDSLDWQFATHVGEYRSQELRLWQSASLCLLVTDCDDAAVVDSYKLLKQVSQATPLPPLELVVWDSDQPQRAEEAAGRLVQTCQSFLSAAIAVTIRTTSLDTYFAEHSEALIDRLRAVAPLSSTGLHIPLAGLPIN